jgi:hypothetical protein
MELIALEQNKNGEFTISYENGKLKREKAELSWAKHNLLCFGRLNKLLTKNPRKRNGDIGNFLEGTNFYSTCWSLYREGVINLATMNEIIREFNSSCSRDLAKGFFDNKITLKSITKLDKYTLNFTIEIGGSSSEITIKI